MYTIACLLGILLLFIGTLWTEDTTYGHTVGVQEGIVSGAENGLYVRSGPSLSSSVIGGLKNGAKVTIQETTEDWAQIEYVNGSGYVSLSYVTVGEVASSQTSPVNNEIIAIDPGHGGKDPGAEAYGLQEKEIALDVGLRVQENLDNLGAEVVMTRTSDVFVGLSERARIANEADASSFVSIHANSFNGEVEGTETFHSPGSEKGKELAAYIQEELLKELGTHDRGVKEAHFAVLSETTMPAVLAEIAFMDHPSDAEKLQSGEHRERIATAITQGIKKYYSHN